MSAKLVILLTGCVNPNGMAYTKLQDPATRLKQYTEAIQWYLYHTNKKVVFVENTLCDFSDIFSEYIESGRLEYITFKGNEYNRSLGKGYGEALIIKEALKRSVFISSSDQILKITGRLILKNLNNIIGNSSKVDTLYANTEIVNGHGICQSFVFVCPPKFLSNFFINNINLLNDSKGYFFEHLLYDSMINWLMLGNAQEEFIDPLIIDGVSGTTGGKYMPSLRFAKIKAFIKYVLHKNGIYRNHLSFGL